MWTLGSAYLGAVGDKYMFGFFGVNKWVCAYLAAVDGPAVVGAEVVLLLIAGDGGTGEPCGSISGPPRAAGRTAG